MLHGGLLAVACQCENSLTITIKAESKLCFAAAQLLTSKATREADGDLRITKLQIEFDETSQMQMLRLGALCFFARREGS